MSFITQVLPPKTSATTQMIDIQSQTLDISPIQTLGNLIEIGARAVLTVGALGVLAFLFIGALKWVTSGGDKSKVEEARNTMTQAVIGLVVLASVFAVYYIILGFFGLRDRIDLNIFGKSFSSREVVPGTCIGCQPGGIPNPPGGGKF